MLFAIEYPADRVTKRSICIVHLKMLFPTAQDQEKKKKKCRRVSEQLSQIIEYLQLNKLNCIYWF